MSIAVWTDSNNRIVRTHHKPEDVDTSDAYIVDSMPSRPDVKPWVEVEEKCDSNGVYYTTTNPFDGLNFTDSEKQAVYDAVMEHDLVEMRSIIESALNS